MASPKQIYNKTNLRLAKSYGYWWDIIIGGFLTSGFMISSGTLVLLEYHLTFWFYPYAVLCILIVVYYQWRDDNLTSIQTGLSKAKNFNLVTSSLDNLNWHYYEKSRSVDLTLNKYLLKFLNPTIIPESEKILINFKYSSSPKTGRLPFFLGISTYLKWRFKRAVKKSLAQTNNLNQIDNKNND